IYMRRIQRGDQGYNWHTLGAYGADLATLAGFFERPWDVPVIHLSDRLKSFVLNEVGVNLRSLGRLQEAMAPAKAALQVTVVNKRWVSASRCASNLTDL